MLYSTDTKIQKLIIAQKCLQFVVELDLFVNYDCIGIYLEMEGKPLPPPPKKNQKKKTKRKQTYFFNEQNLYKPNELKLLLIISIISLRGMCI